MSWLRTSTRLTAMLRAAEGKPPRRPLTRSRRRVSVGALIAIVITLAFLSGWVWTDPQTRPSYPPVEKPAVVWASGEPNGPWEDNPWIIALREYEYETAAGWNARNFTDPKLAELTTYLGVLHLIDDAENATDSPYGYPVRLGPLPFTVVNVDEYSRPGEAIIDICAYDSWESDATTGEPTPQKVFRTVVLSLGEDGHRRVDRELTPGRRSCPEITIPEGRFTSAPAPEPPHTHLPNEVVPPSPKEELWDGMRAD